MNSAKSEVLRFVVTGGSGFIGSHLIAALAERGHRIINLDIQAPTVGLDQAEWRNVDLRDADAVQAAVADISPQVVINLAALTDISLSFDEMPVNTTGLRNVIRAMQSSVPEARLIHASTQFVVKAGYRSTHVRDYAPYTEYGRTKAASEEILWEESGSLHWTIVRPTAVWGPRHPVFPLSTWKYLRRRWYMIVSGINPCRSFGYVGNVASQIITAATADPDSVNRQVFYVGDTPMASAVWLDGFSKALSGRPVRRMPRGALRALAEAGEMMKRLTGRAPFDRGRFERISNDYLVDMEPCFATLGAGPYSFDDGVRQTVDWLRETYPKEFVAR